MDDDALFDKIVLYKRGLVAAASNHAERFHSKLKKVAKERKGFLYNISKLYEIMNQRLEKYVSGFQGDKQCSRIKNRLLAEQKKFNITPIEVQKESNIYPIISNIYLFIICLCSLKKQKIFLKN